jgi:hypothetical protein
MPSTNRKRLTQRIRIALRAPRKLRPTRAGWMFLLINLGVGVAPRNTAQKMH